MVHYIFSVIPLKWRLLTKQLFSGDLFSPLKFIIHIPG
nr:ORF2 [Homo sapiens]